MKGVTKMQRAYEIALTQLWAWKICTQNMCNNNTRQRVEGEHWTDAQCAMWRQTDRPSEWETQGEGIRWDIGARYKI